MNKAWKRRNMKLEEKKKSNSMCLIQEKAQPVPRIHLLPLNTARISPIYRP